MTFFVTPSVRLGKRHLAAFLLSTTLLLAGCANMTSTTSSPVVAAVASRIIEGGVHGGNQPVAYATVALYAAGMTGYGSAPTLYATTHTADDNYGSFAFQQNADAPGGTYGGTGSNQYSCPTPGAGVQDPAMYLVSRGGNTLNSHTNTVNNTASVFIIPLGLCHTVASDFVDMSEVTTTATVAALAQFMSATPGAEGLGYDGILEAAFAMANSFNLVHVLTNTSNGTANTNFSIGNAGGGYNATGIYVMATPEYAKINTVANILSACINQTSATSGPYCNTLFTNAVPPSPANTSQPNGSFPAATDTLQAALYMFLNPTDGGAMARGNLYNLQAGSSPYTPTLTAAPTDWTLSVAYSSTGTCSGGGAFLNSPYSVSLDQNGDVWMANSASANGGTGGTLVEFNPYGNPLSCVTTGGSGSGSTIDSSGNVWYVDSSSNNLYRFNAASAATVNFPTTAHPLAITADGSGRIFYATANALYVITGAATATSAVAGTQVSNVVGVTPSSIFPDPVGNIWVTSGSNFVTQVYSGGTSSNPLNGYNSVTFPVNGPSYGITAGPATGSAATNNLIFVTSPGSSNQLTVLAPSGATYAVQTTSAVSAGGLTGPAGIALDGAEDSWIANNIAESSTGLYSLSELTSAGTSLSADGATNGGFQKTLAALNKARGMAIDAAGDVWVTSDGTAGNANTVTEIVGAAVRFINRLQWAWSKTASKNFPDPHGEGTLSSDQQRSELGD